MRQYFFAGLSLHWSNENSLTEQRAPKVTVSTDNVICFPSDVQNPRFLQWSFLKNVKIKHFINRHYLSILRLEKGEQMARKLEEDLFNLTGNLHVI